MQDPDNRRVFISHSNVDPDVSLLPLLLAKLNEAGFRPVVAEHATRPMEQLGEKVREMIESCGFFLTLLTAPGQSSVWIQQELGFAYKHLKRDKTIAVLVQEGVGLGGFYTGLEYFLFENATFERTVETVISYFSRVINGEIQVTLLPKKDTELRKTIDRVRTETKEMAISQLMGNVGSVLDSVITSFATAFQDPDSGIMTRCGLDNFSMRTETFVYLMDAVRKELKDSLLDRSLYRAGLQAGRSFGADFCDHVLLKNRVTVDSYDDLLQFWLYYDQTSGWGRPRLVRGLPDVLIEIDNSFLVRKSGRNTPHRYCDFIRGYVDGFLQFTMRRVSRYVREAGFNFKGSIFTPSVVKHEPGLEHQCLLRVGIAEEDPRLTPAFDHLFRAGIANVLGDGLRCVNQGRAAMEFGVKGMLGLGIGDHTSFHEMVRQLFPDEQAASRLAMYFGSPKHYREVYGQLSGTIHQLEEPGRDECRTSVLTVDEFLSGIERVFEE
jgi:TIR domain